MGLLSFLKKGENLIAIDIGSTSVKLIELNLTPAQPELVNCAMLALNGDIFSGGILTKGEVVSEKINTLLESNSVGEKRVVTAVPSTSVFTKKIRVQKMKKEELATNIQFEASNFIPHNISAVQLDYQVTAEIGRNQIEVLVAAVKNEILDSYLDSIALTGLKTAVVDVDYFALQNIFEFAYPERVSDTIALMNIGQRFTSVNICREGNSLYAGDISVGTKQVIVSLENNLEMKRPEIESILMNGVDSAANPQEVKAVMEAEVSQIAAELARHVTFFWNASGSDDGIDEIMISGGGALLPGMVDQLQEKTDLKVTFIDPLRGFKIGEGFEKSYLNEVGPFMAICAGLAIRQPGDKIIPEYMA